MKRTKRFSYLIIIWMATFAACQNDKDQNNGGYTPIPLTINVPGNLPQMIIPADNPTTVEGVELGRRLYYDSILDPFHSRACASCHLQKYGFTSLGTNVIPHINLAYNKKFLWNGAVSGTLEDAMLFEVEEFFHTDVSKLQKSSSYPNLFYRAFGSTKIDTRKCANAMAQFLRTLVSGNSKFDRFVRHEEYLTQDEFEGYILFFTEKGDCFHCHSMSLMTDGGLHNIGLDSVFTGVNQGYFAISHDSADLGKFKTPSIRNAALRTSFMHDGRFTSLSEVIEHYNSGVKFTPSVDPIMTRTDKILYGLQLNQKQKQNLMAFINTLTDSTYLTNPAFHQ